MRDIETLDSELRLTRHSPSPPDKTKNGRAAAVAFSLRWADIQRVRFPDEEWAMIPQVNASDIAQAMELVRALRDQLHEMTHRLVLLECHDVIGTNSRVSAIRCEAAALRLDIHEAQILIDRLQRRYLNRNGNERTVAFSRAPSAALTSRSRS